MKRVAIILSTLVILLGVVGCDESTQTPTTLPTGLTVSPSQLTLKVGEQSQLSVTVTPEGVSYTISYVSDHPDIATVDQTGRISAIAVGTATITLSVGELSKQVSVTVIEEQGGSGGHTNQNEMPLLRFGIDKDDPTLLAHEEQLGRTKELVQVGQNKFSGYVNRKLTTIPAVVYHLYTTDRSITLAFSREEITACDNTQAMLREIGFTTLDPGMYSDGSVYLLGINEQDPTIQVEIYPSRDETLGTNMILEFSTHRDIQTEHTLISTAQDFPSLEALFTEEVNAMKAFEEELGLRLFNPAESAEGNAFFDTKSERMAESNFYWVYYNNIVPDQQVPYIDCAVNFIKKAEDLTDPKIKDWFTQNGFGTDYEVFPEYDNWIEAYNEDKTLFCQLFVGDRGYANLQLSRADDTYAMSQASRVRLARTRAHKRVSRAISRELHSL